MGKFLAILENDERAEVQNLSAITEMLVRDKIGSIIYEPASGFPRDLPDSVCGVIVGGGLPSVNDPKKWIKKEIDLIARVSSIGLPILGICFGHQLIAKAYGAEVVRRERKTGFADIIKLINNPIFASLPGSWRSPVYHQDRVEELPEDFELIATSDYCEIQAMAHKELPIWTVQFHPEISYGINDFFADPVEPWNDRSAFEDAPNKQLIDNFVDICLAR